MALLPDIPNHVPSETYLNGNWTSTIAPFWCRGPSKFWLVYKYNARHHGEFHIANIVLFVSLLAFSTWRTPSECMSHCKHCFVCEFISLFYLKNTLWVHVSHFSWLLDDKLDLRAALQMRSARSWPQCMIVSCMLTDSELGTAFCAILRVGYVLLTTHWFWWIWDSSKTCKLGRGDFFTCQLGR
jgi:hypothetical protein